MSDTITLTGVVATPPSTVRTEGGLIITHFRLASNNRRFDTASQRWVDGESSFYSISAFRQTAHNVLASVGQGDRVVVTGRLKIKEWTTGDRKGVTAEVDADSLGHDLSWGQSQFTKVSRSGGRAQSNADDGFPQEIAPSVTDGFSGPDVTTDLAQLNGGVAVVEPGSLGSSGGGLHDEGDFVDSDEADLNAVATPF